MVAQPPSVVASPPAGVGIAAPKCVLAVLLTLFDPAAVPRLAGAQRVPGVHTHPAALLSVVHNTRGAKELQNE